MCKKLIISCVIVLMAITIVFCTVGCDNENPQTTPMPTTEKEFVKEHESILFPELKSAEQIYVLNPVKCISLTGKKSFSEASTEFFMAVSLQGIIAQTKADLYIVHSSDGTTSKWLEYITESYSKTTETIDSMDELLNQYKDRLNDCGYIRVNLKTAMDPINSMMQQACTIAGAKQWVIVPVKEKDSEVERILQEEYGMKLKYDLFDKTNEDYSIADAIKEFESYLNKDVMIATFADRFPRLMDFGIAMKAPFYGYTKQTSEEEKEEIFNIMNPLTNILGWQDGSHPSIDVGEGGQIGYASSNGRVYYAADWFANLSFYASLPRENMQQKEYIQYAEEKTKDQYHYATLVCGEGDNLVWCSDVCFQSNKMGSEYWGEMPFGWTVSPTLIETAPQVIKHLFEKQTGNETFICSAYGYGYIDAATMLSGDKEAFLKYAERTAQMMESADMDYLLSIETDPSFDAMDIFSSYDSIQGGFIGNDQTPGRKGGIYWTENGKPWLWIKDAPDGHYDTSLTGTAAVEDAMAKLAVRVSSYPTDITKIEGYSLLGFGQWSYDYNQLYKYFYSNLDQSKVKLVTPAEFMDLVIENVERKTRFNISYPSWTDEIYTAADGLYNQQRDKDYTKLSISDSRLTYEGQWKDVSGRRIYENCAKKSEETGASIQFSFNGTAFRIYGVMMENSGIGEVYVNGEKVGEFDCYADATSYHKILFEQTDLTAGDQNIEIRVTGRKNEQANGCVLTIDAIGVY